MQTRLFQFAASSVMQKIGNRGQAAATHLCPNPYPNPSRPNLLFPTPPSQLLLASSVLLIPIPDCILPVLYSLFPVPYSLFPVPYSLFPVPYSLFPIPCSLFPVPYSLFPVPFAYIVGSLTGYISK